MMPLSCLYSNKDQDFISYFPQNLLPLRSIFKWTRPGGNCPNGPLSDLPVQVRQQGININLIKRCQRLKQTQVPKKDLKSQARVKSHFRKLLKGTFSPKNPRKEKG
jgi:hypothetical protein